MNLRNLKLPWPFTINLVNVTIHVKGDFTAGRKSQPMIHQVPLIRPHFQKRPWNLVPKYGAF